jgi:uncharacterized protein (TIGR03067 family)
MSAASLEDEVRKFQGSWRQVAYERDGVPGPADDEAGWEPRTTFTGDRFVVTIADGSSPIAGTFTIDPTTEPRSVDYTDTHGADAGKTFLAIYVIDAETLTFCAAGEGLPRPTSFHTKAGEVLRVNRREPAAGG